MPGVVITLAVAEGHQVTKGQKLCTLEAMKMETTIYAEQAGRVAEILAGPGAYINAGDLLMRIEP